MRVAINLASEPFRRDRPLVAGSIAVGVMLVGLLGMLIYLAVGERARAAEAREAIVKTETQLKIMQRERAQVRKCPATAAERGCSRSQRIPERSAHAQGCELDSNFLGSGKGDTAQRAADHCTSADSA